MRRNAVIGGSLAIVVVAIVVAVRLQHPSSSRNGLTPENAPALAKPHSDRLGPGAPSASMSGRVTRIPDGTSVAGANVSITRISIGFGMRHVPAIVVVTDGDGAWTVPDLPPGAYIVAATAVGFLAQANRKVSMSSGARATIDIVLSVGGTTVRGLVTDVGGGPIANARITAKDEDDGPTETTNLVAFTTADGSYQLTLRDGSFDVTASHDDYTRESRSTVEIAGKPVPLDFVLIPGGVIRGQVVTRYTDTPVAGAVIQASGKCDDGVAASAITDSDGNFMVRGLGPGALSITAVARGYASSSATTVELGIGEHVDGIHVVVDRAFSVTGRVVRKGSPTESISGVQVSAYSPDSREWPHAFELSSADGAFEIVGVRSGIYTLYANDERFMPAMADRLEIKDRDVTGVVVEMTTGATLTGRVELESIARIYLAPPNESDPISYKRQVWSVHGKADATGSFVLRAVPNGKLTIIATTATGHTGKLPIVVADADQTGLVIPLERRASISGKVTDSNGVPVAGAQIEALQDFPGTRTTSRADGSYKLVGLEAGKVRIGASDPDYSAFASCETEEKAFQPVELDLAAGVDRTNVNLMIKVRDGVVRGQVLGLDGKPAADAWVTAHREAPREIFEMWPQSQPVLTGADGRFVIERVCEGTYTLVAEGARGSSRGQMSGIKTPGPGTVTLSPLGSLAIRVVAGAAPVPVYDLDCRGPTGRVERHATARDGRYSLDHLAPGSYKCWVTADEGSKVAFVEVPPGAAELEISLARWASITGTLVDERSGKPVANIIVRASSRDGRVPFSDEPAITDASGRFVVTRAPAGSGWATAEGTGGSSRYLGDKEYTASAGQRVDIGTIRISTAP